MIDEKVYYQRRSKQAIDFINIWGESREVGGGGGVGGNSVNRIKRLVCFEMPVILWFYVSWDRYAPLLATFSTGINIMKTKDSGVVAGDIYTRLHCTQCETFLGLYRYEIKIYYIYM